MSLALASRRAAISPAWVKNPLWRTARAVPSLDLQFADTKSLADAVTGQSLITFTRASSGTYVGSDGLIKTAANDVPRFDHNPTTGESLGLLVEEQRTNLLIYSEDFGNAAYTLVAATVSTNAAVAPDGATTADNISSSGTSTVSQSYTKAATSQTLTATMFVKGSSTAFSFTIDDGTATNRGRCVFNLSTGSIVLTSNDGTFTGTVGLITSFSNNWYRLSVTTTTNTTTIARHRFFWTGAGTSVDVWGAQLEAGAFPTSYIPTTTATATRSTDVASITGTAFSSWYRQDEGSFYVSFSHPALPVQAGARIFNASNSTATDQFWGRMAGGSSVALDVSVSGISQATFSAGNPSANETSRAAIAARANDFFASRNGTGYGPDVSGAMPSALDRLGIGMEAVSNGSQLNGTIRRLVFFPQRLPNSTIQAITQ